MKKHVKLWTSIVILLATVVTGCNSASSSNNSQADKNKFIEKYQPPAKPPKFAAAYDVIVIGGEAEGVAAAVSSARNGAKTLLVEHRSGLGGLLTFGMLNFLDIKHGSDGKSINQGLFDEWHKLVGGDSAFDIELGKAAFYKMVSDEKNLTLALDTELVSAQLGADGSTVTGVTLRNKNGELSVTGKRFIDATIDADFAAMSGAPFFIGGEDIFDKDRLMSVTPVIHLKGIDWAKLKKASKGNGWKFGKVDFNDTTAWGFAELFKLYKPIENNTRLRGLNLVRIRQSDGEHFYINALQIFGVNGLNENEKKTALEVGRRETEHIVEYLRKEMAGFQKATIASNATELYVRETRHLKALYQLPMSDIWRNQDHWDSIGYGGYPVDIQGTSLQDLGTVVSNPKTYAIPFRSLIPQKLTNMLVVGRAAGYSSIAAGSARVVPTGMTTGEAAGAAAVQSIKSSVNFHKFSADKKMIETLRTTLEKQGALVKHFNSKYPYQGEWYDNAVTFLVNYGLTPASYSNDLKVGDPLKTNHLANIFAGGMKRINPEELKKNENNIRSLYVKSNDTLLTRNQAAKYLITAFSNEKSGANDWDTALKLKLIDKTTHDKIAKERTLTKAEGYAIAASVLTKFVIRN